MTSSGMGASGPARTCPNCDSLVTRADLRFCPNCGALLQMSPPESEERRPPPAPLQQRTAQPPLPRQPSPQRGAAAGPLLTGRIAIDAALGFLGEIAAAALIIYGIVLFWIALSGGVGSGATALTALGAIATGIFLFWHTQKMRERYPNFAQGWQVGRNTWGKVADHLFTLLFGVAVLIVLFPLGMLVVCGGAALGPAGWIGAVVITYVLGMLARRMRNTGKPKGGSTP